MRLILALFCTIVAVYGLPQAEVSDNITQNLDHYEYAPVDEERKEFWKKWPRVPTSEHIDQVTQEPSLKEPGVNPEKDNIENPVDNDDRIIGGKITTTNYPFMVSIQHMETDNKTKVQKREHFCGGAIIDQKWILTAAHCMIDEDVYVVAGTRDYTSTAKTIQVVKVAKKFWPNTFDGLYFTDDVGLLKLEKALKFNQLVQPIELAKPTDPKTTGEVIMIGWGFENSTGTPKVSKQLQELKAPLRDRKKCYTTNEYKSADNELCAGQYGKTVCTGDSGSPLIQKIKNGYKQVGVTSFVTVDDDGKACVGDAIYMDVRKYKDGYIKETMDKNK